MSDRLEIVQGTSQSLSSSNQILESEDRARKISVDHYFRG